MIFLRLTIALNAIAYGVGILLASGEPLFYLWAMGLLAVIIGIALLIGFLTPLAGAAATASYLAMGASRSFAFGLLGSAIGVTAFDLAAVSVAILLLGPGAYSLDARLFGRREIIISGGSRPRS